MQLMWQEYSARNIIYFTDKKEEDLHIEFNMYVWKLHILFHNVLAPKNNQVTEQVVRAKIRDKINNDSEWIFLQVSMSAIANPFQTIICRNQKLCDYEPTNIVSSRKISRMKMTTTLPFFWKYCKTPLTALLILAKRRHSQLFKSLPRWRRGFEKKIERWWWGGGGGLQLWGREFIGFDTFLLGVTKLR